MPQKLFQNADLAGVDGLPAAAAVEAGADEGVGELLVDRDGQVTFQKELSYSSNYFLARNVTNIM